MLEEKNSYEKLKEDPTNHIVKEVSREDRTHKRQLDHHQKNSGIYVPNDPDLDPSVLRLTQNTQGRLTTKVDSVRMQRSHREYVRIQTELPITHG